MMPSAEERHRDAARAREALFLPRPQEPAQPPPSAATLRAADLAAPRGYARDRAARIRRGACPVRAERLCPRVGGRDVACVVG